MRKKPEILASEVVAATRIFRVEQLDLRFDNGVETRYERLVGSAHGAVVVVPVTAERDVLLVREYAAGVDRYEVGLPKGRIEPGEPLIEAANREIMEEVGVGARQLTHLTSLTLAPGYLGHVSHVVLAQDLYESPMPGDEPEEVEAVPWPLDDVDGLLARGECTEARTIAALYMVREMLSRPR